MHTPKKVKSVNIRASSEMKPTNRKGNLALKRPTKEVRSLTTLGLT